MTVHWRSGELLAWTERDGPGRPPAGPSRMLALPVAACLGVVFLGMLATDALCPEHRAWINGLATAALLLAGFAIVGLVRGWTLAPASTLLTALCGVAMGAIDASHDATRGSILALAFGAVAVLTAVLAWRQQSLRRWEQRTNRALPGTDVSAPVTPDVRVPPGEPRDRAASDLRARR